MKRSLMFAIALAGLGTAAPVLADEEGCRAPMANWHPREAVEKMADARGWKERRIRMEDGCYAIRARDAEGRRVKVRVDPASLALLGTEHEHEDEHEDDDDDGARGPRAAPAGTVAPPDNGLFRKGGAGVVIK